MPRIIMNRAFIARWTRMPHSTGQLSASASSHHSLSSAAFITNIAESDFRHAQVECLRIDPFDLRSLWVDVKPNYLAQDMQVFLCDFDSRHVLRGLRQVRHSLLLACHCRSS